MLTFDPNIDRDQMGIILECGSSLRKVQKLVYGQTGNLMPVYKFEKKVYM